LVHDALLGEDKLKILELGEGAETTSKLLRRGTVVCWLAAVGILVTASRTLRGREAMNVVLIAPSSLR
jgi:hypothetical protein